MADTKSKESSFRGRLAYAMEERMRQYFTKRANSFFARLIGIFLNVDSILPNSILALFFHGGDFTKALYDMQRYNYHSNYNGYVFDEDVANQVESAKIKENPIKEIAKKTNFGEKYRFSLYKNQLNVMEAFNFGDRKGWKEYIDAVKSEHSKDMEWVPDIATEIGEYHKAEVLAIFNGLSFEAKKQLLEKIDTSVITDEKLKQIIENIKNCKTNEEFNAGLGALYSYSFKEINGANILLGLCDIGLLEELTKKEFIQKLETENKHSSSQKTILATAMNKSASFEIHSPKGVVSEDAMKLAYLKKGITPEQFKEECQKNPNLARVVWGSEGHTHTDYKKNHVTVSVANNKDAIDTFLHEGTHANLASLFNAGYLNFFPDDNQELKTELYEKINKNLKQLNPKFKEILKSKTINTKDLLHALGVFVENAEEAQEFLDFAKELDKFLNDKIIEKQKNSYLEIGNPFLRLKYIMDREGFEKYKNINAKVVHKISEFLEKEDFENSKIKNKDTVQLIQNIYLTPALHPLYASKGEKTILEESVVRVNEYRKDLTKVLPNSKPLNKVLNQVDRMEELIYFQNRNISGRYDNNSSNKQMDFNGLPDKINPLATDLYDLKGDAGNKHKFESTFGKSYEPKQKAQSQSIQEFNHRLALSENVHNPLSRKKQN